MGITFLQPVRSFSPRKPLAQSMGIAYLRYAE